VLAAVKQHGVAVVFATHAPSQQALELAGPARKQSMYVEVAQQR
jgi:hypothetical protein